MFIQIQVRKTYLLWWMANSPRKIQIGGFVWKENGIFCFEISLGTAWMICPSSETLWAFLRAGHNMLSFCFMIYTNNIYYITQNYAPCMKNGCQVTTTHKKMSKRTTLTPEQWSKPLWHVINHYTGRSEGNCLLETPHNWVLLPIYTSQPTRGRVWSLLISHGGCLHWVSPAPTVRGATPSSWGPDHLQRQAVGKRNTHWQHGKMFETTTQ